MGFNQEYSKMLAAALPCKPLSLFLGEAVNHAENLGHRGDLRPSDFVLSGRGRLLIRLDIPSRNKCPPEIADAQTARTVSSLKAGA